MMRLAVSLALAALLGAPVSQAGPEQRTCVPGQTVTLVGTAPALAGLVVRFGDRIVAGAAVSRDGRYTIDLQIGQEPPGRHLVAIETRDPRSVVRLLTCVVPGAGDSAQRAAFAAAAPTPLPLPAPAALPAPSRAPVPVLPTAVLPTPTPVVTSTPADVAEPADPDATPLVEQNGAQRVVRGRAPTGWAELTGSAALYVAAPPRAGEAALRTYEAGTRVRLLGQFVNTWAQVQPPDAVVPGWMDAAQLRFISDSTGPAPTREATPTAVSGTGAVTTTAVLSGTTTPAQPAGALTAPPTAPLSAGVTSATLTILPTPTAAPTGAVVPVARTVAVEVCRTRSATARVCGGQVAGVRVALLLAATGEEVARATTDVAGTATLAVSAAPGAALTLQLPALGLEVRVPEQDSAPLVVMVPPKLDVRGGAP
ncbi:MAG TPA: hypothetical protein VFS21_36470 [Roseiflexaceae bacterium]|nr:hypothetical protein [Roseiflexaceae bacterium]